MPSGRPFRDSLRSGRGVGLQPPFARTREQVTAWIGGLAVRPSATSSEANGRHVHSIRRAQLRLILVAPTSTEAALLIETDPHFSEAITGSPAGNSDHVRLEMRIGGKEFGDEFTRSDSHALVDCAVKAARNLDLVVKPPSKIEIAVHTKP